MERISSKEKEFIVDERHDEEHDTDAGLGLLDSTVGTKIRKNWRGTKEHEGRKGENEDSQSEGTNEGKRLYSCTV